ncbi:hypothetical protein PODO_06915 [Paenibacillus odorifer]|nr:hypothetical protein PODO_06915 [Paenibacillus odorifer]
MTDPIDSPLRLIKLMIQLHQRPLLYPRNPQLLRDLPLRPLLPAGVQAEAAGKDLYLLCAHPLNNK